MGARSDWSHRVARYLKQAPHSSVLICKRSSGVEHALRRMDEPSMPLVRYWANDVADDRNRGARLATAVRRALGSPLIAPATNTLQGIEILHRETQEIGPLRVVVGWLDYCEEIASGLLQTMSPPSRLLIIGSESVADATILQTCNYLDSAELMMREPESVYAARGLLPPDEAVSLMKLVDGEYGTFLEELSARTHSADVSSELEVGAIHTPPHDALDSSDYCRTLIARGKWAEALEHACDYCPELVPEVIEMGGHQLANLGAFDYLSTLLHRLPLKVRRHPKTAYWMLAAAIATNRVKQFGPLPEFSLGVHEAPEMWAALAVQRPSAGMVSETRAAVEASYSPVTMRAHAFALFYEGEQDAAVHLFRSAMRKAEQSNADHLVIACAQDISNLETALGRYSNGVGWAKWALIEYHRRGLNEELRRQPAVAGVVYSSILLGELDTVPDLIESIGPYISRLGVPTYEGVVSTIGDWEFINERFGAALIHYERVHDSAAVDQSAFNSLDLIRCLVASGNETRALEIATQVHTVSQSSSRQERALADLGLAMATHRADPRLSAELLLKSIESLGETCFLVLQAQAAIWLALLRLRSGDINGTREALRLGRSGLAELGSSGWKLLSGMDPSYERLRSIWLSGASTTEIALLGRRSLRKDGITTDIPLRFAEIIALLAANPNGLKGQRLQSMLFGDGGTEANVKAALSKLRRLVPITPSPYRLPDSTQIDFQDLLASINAGEMQRALTLYKGPLLPESEAPGVVELRSIIDESLRLAVLDSGDPELLIQLATTMSDDLELWEAARLRLPGGDNRRPLISARIRRIHANW